MSVWLVTGGAGFLGRHVLSALDHGARASTRVVALGRRPPVAWPVERFWRCDLANVEGLTEAIRAIAPDRVIHAAGRTPPGSPISFYQDNTRSTVNLFAALRAAGRPVRVVLVGSAAELGPVAVDALPVGEGYRCRPREPYGLSKWFGTAAGLAARPPLEVIAARVFNPIGPATPPNQAFGRFAARLAEPGPDPLPLVVGDLETRRDFIDARDVADALLALAERGQSGLTYHLGTGRSHRIGAGLAHLIHLSGRSVDLEIRPAAAYPQGPADSRADISRLVDHTGWWPRIPFEQSLDDLWADVLGHPARAIWPRHVA